MTSSINKILIIQHYTGIGGSSLASIDVAKAVNAIGRKAIIALPGKGTPLSDLLKGYEINYIEGCPDVINFTYHSASSGILRASVKYSLKKKYKKQWKKIIRDILPDAVLLNSGAQNPMIEIVKEMGIPCICYVRETIRHNSSNLFNLILRKKIAKADAVLFLSKYDKDQWAVNNKNQFIVPEIVGSHFYGKKSRIKNSPNVTVLYLGGFNYEKGVHEVVEAFTHIEDKNVTLEILGDDGKSMSEISNIIKKIIYHKQIKVVNDTKEIIAELDKRGMKIHVRGIQSNVNEWYEKADIVVFPVKKVHQARPVYEAGMYSLPVIVPDYRNFAESVSDGVNGLVYKKDRPDDMAEKITKLAHNAELRKTLGENNRKKAIKNHSEGYVSQIIENVINSLA